MTLPVLYYNFQARMNLVRKDLLSFPIDVRRTGKAVSGYAAEVRRNHRLNALIGKGCLKVNNFRNSDNKLAYAYLLTPHGVEQKARMTVEFLQIKIHEYERLSMEIAELKLEAEQNGR